MSFIVNPFIFGTATSTLLTDLLVYYKFSETTGTTVSDETGTYNGTASSSSIWTASGKIGRGTTYSASGINITYDAAARKISTDVGYSFNFWFRKNTDGRMFSFGKQVDSNNFIQIDFRADGEWGVHLRESGTFSLNADTEYTSGSNSNDNLWHMATISWSSTGTVVKYYEDNVLLFTKSGMSSQNFPNTQQRIGTERANYVPLSWNGEFDEWAVWRKELIADERTSLYNSGSGNQYPF